MIDILKTVYERLNPETFDENAGLIIELAELPENVRKERFFRILNLLELKVAAHCGEANQEVKQFGEIVCAFRAAEHLTRH